MVTIRRYLTVSSPDMEHGLTVSSTKVALPRLAAALWSASAPSLCGALRRM